MAIDTFDTNVGATTPVGPATRCFAVSPSDSTDIAFTARALYVGVSGDIAIRTPGSSTTVTLRNAVAGTILPVSVARVMATGTTASGLVALY